MGSCVQIPAVPFLFLNENVGFYRESNPGPSNPKSAMLTLRPRRLKFWCKKNFVCNSTGWEMWRPPPRGNKLESNLGGIGLRQSEHIYFVTVFMWSKMFVLPFHFGFFLRRCWRIKETWIVLFLSLGGPFFWSHPVYLQHKKSSGIEIDRPIHKRLAINLLEGMAKRTSPTPGLIGLSTLIGLI